MKLNSLQVLRAVAAWLVVWHHYAQIIHEMQFDTSAGLFFGWYGNFGVDIFFLISGFIMVHALRVRPRPTRAFLSDRVTRIVPAYWTATLVFIALGLVLPSFGPDAWGVDVKSLFSSLFFIPHLNPGGAKVPLLSVGWSLNAEMAFYLLITIALWVSGQRWWLFCIPILILGPIVFRWAEWSTFIFDVRLFWEFAAGIAVALLYPRSGFGMKGLFAAPVLVIWGVYFLLSGGALLGGAFVFERLLAATLFLLAALSLEPVVSQRFLSRPLVRLGEISYSTYLVHVPIIFLFALAFEKPGSMYGVAALILAIGFSTWLASEVFHRYVETAPIWRRLVDHLFDRRRPQHSA